MSRFRTCQHVKVKNILSQYRIPKQRFFQARGGRALFSGLWVRALGSESEFGLWVRALGSESEFGLWVRDLDSGSGFGLWVRDLDSGSGFGLWIRDLGLGSGFGIWVRVLSLGSGVRPWAVGPAVAAVRVQAGSGSGSELRALHFGLGGSPLGCWTGGGGRHSPPEAQGRSI